MRIMRFNDFLFREGEQTTFRKGDKWATGAGEEIGIADETGEVKGRAYIVQTSFKPFNKLCPVEINQWHLQPKLLRRLDPSYRWQRILEMVQAYSGLDGFRGTELVSVVWFEVTELYGKTGEELRKMLRGES